MLSRDLIEKGGVPRGTYLQDTLATEAGRMTILYILTQLGFFCAANGADEAAVRNAAGRLLADISARTGFVLDIGLSLDKSISPVNPLG